MYDQLYYKQWKDEPTTFYTCRQGHTEYTAETTSEFVTHLKKYHHSLSLSPYVSISDYEKPKSKHSGAKNYRLSRIEKHWIGKSVSLEVTDSTLVLLSGDVPSGLEENSSESRLSVVSPAMIRHGEKHKPLTGWVLSLLGESCGNAFREKVIYESPLTGLLQKCNFFRGVSSLKDIKTKMRGLVWILLDEPLVDYKQSKIYKFAGVHVDNLTVLENTPYYTCLEDI